MAGEFHDVVAQRLRGVQQRYTRNRRALVDALETAEHPLTIPEILDADASLAMSSVYRNLAVLEQADVVHRVVTTDEFARYELVEDLTEHHHHLICSSCGKVEDFTPTPALERSAADALARIADQAGFRVHSHRLDVVGLCHRCA